MERDRIASPVYSITWPTPPCTPILPMIANIISLALTPKGKVPLTLTSIVLGLNWRNVWVANTCSTSEVPIPRAKQPNAP